MIWMTSAALKTKGHGRRGRKELSRPSSVVTGFRRYRESAYVQILNKKRSHTHRVRDPRVWSVSINGSKWIAWCKQKSCGIQACSKRADSGMRDRQQAVLAREARE